MLLSVLSCTIILYCTYADALTYEARGKEVVAKIQALKTSWSAKISPRFVGQDEFVLKKFCGIKPDFATKFNRKYNGTKPFGKQKGRGGKGKKHGNHTKSWEEKKHKSWEQKNQRNNNNNNNNFPHHRVNRATALPESYDWRDYTDCKSFDQIRYQNCGDCWAVASAAAMSDRYCLYTWRNKYFSAKQITSCVYNGGGCGGGYPQDAAKFYLNTGVATGNDPTVTEQPAGCIKYPSAMDNSVACPTRCDDGRALDFTKAGDWREFTSRNQEDIKQELYIYGSVVAIFEVFQDFGYMGSGVYQHAWGASQGWHAIRLIGWGVENGIPYWQAANQWGTEWGDEGFFKILRGSNHCGIEGWIVGVYPIEAWQQ